MAKLLLTPENQIQRLNKFLDFVENLQEKDLTTLTTPLNEKAWNVLEVLEHLSISYDLYELKIKTALQETGDSNGEVWEHQPSFWNTLVIESQRPKGTKRPFKIKTLKRFEPLLPEPITENVSGEVFERFLNCHKTLKHYILDSRTKTMAHKRLSSAIGPIVKFHLPEAFEFLICHAERHKVQINEILAAQN